MSLSQAMRVSSHLRKMRLYPRQGDMSPTPEANDSRNFQPGAAGNPMAGEGLNTDPSLFYGLLNQQSQQPGGLTDERFRALQAYWQGQGG